MKKLCVILSGTGISGYATVALVEFLRKYKIQPDQIIGCSTGAFISAMWAMELSNEQMHQHIQQHYDLLLNKDPNYMTPITMFKTPSGNYNKSKAFYNVNKLRGMLNNVFDNQNIENLETSTIIQTTNVDTGTSFKIRNGLISDAVYASGAMLPFYPAIEINNQWLADGSFTAPLPINTALEQNYDVILVLMPETIYEAQPNSFMAYYSNFVQKAIKHLNATQNIISLYLQHEEVIIIPVLFENINQESPPDLNYLINAARKEIDKKESLILEKVLER